MNNKRYFGLTIVIFIVFVSILFYSYTHKLGYMPIAATLFYLLTPTLVLLNLSKKDNDGISILFGGVLFIIFLFVLLDKYLRIHSALSRYLADKVSINPVIAVNIIYVISFLVVISFFYRFLIKEYKQNPDWIKLFIFAVLIIVAGVFATVDEKFNIRSFFNPSVGIGLTAMAFLAINNASIKWAFTFNDVWTVNLWIGIISFLVILPTLPLFYKDLYKIKAKQLWPVGLMGLFQTLTNFTLTSALAVNVGITSIIMSLPISMILAVLFSIYAPKLLEKHATKIYVIRFAAAIIMIYGALQLSR